MEEENACLLDCTSRLDINVTMGNKETVKFDLKSHYFVVQAITHFIINSLH